MISNKSIRVRLTSFSIALISLLCISMFSLVPVVPVSGGITNVTLWMVTNNDPGPGYYGGYYPIVAKLVEEFKEINITLEWVQYDPGEWEDIVWGDETWNRVGDYDGNGVHNYGVDGWDLTIFEWWLNPSSYIWLDEMAYSWATPPTGWNIMSWNDTTAEILYQRAQTQQNTPLGTSRHMQYMHAWQERFMHNPPAIPIYAAEQKTGRASYLDNYDDVAWLYDLSQLDINETKFWEVAPSTRQAIGPNKVIWAAAEDIWTLFPFGTLTYTEETVNVLKQGMLYRQSRENLAFPPSGPFKVLPTLATGFPSWSQLPEPDGRWVARVNLVEGLTWTSGAEFNATDVKFTWDCNLDNGMKSESYGDYNYLIDEVNIAGRYAVDFVYKPGMGPDYDFAGYMAHGWALGMLSYAQFNGVKPKNWAGAGFSQDPIPDSADAQYDFTGPNIGLECLGPYVPISYTGSPGALTSITFAKRANFVDTLGWSPNMPDEFILKIIGDAGTRFSALKLLEADFIEYPIAPLGDWAMIEGWDSHRVYTFPYPATHPLWIQQRNSVLCNRFVRQAIAHAIPYDWINTEVLDDWGVQTPIRARTFILPTHDVFHPDLDPYEYDLNKARMYMNMWQYSRAGEDYTQAPLGDHDFNGLVEMRDYPIWVNNLGKAVGDLPWYPSQPVDPDNNNNGLVELDDSWYWGPPYFGKEYPFPDPR